MDNTQTKLIAIAIVAIVAIAGIAVVFTNQGGNDKNDGNIEAAWKEILEDAKGQKVNMGFYAEAKTVPFLNDYLIPAAKELGITVTYESYGPLAANTVKTEMDNGVTEKGTFDLIWGDTSAFSILYDNGTNKYLYAENWTSKLPNYAYMSDGKEDAVKNQFSNYVEGSAMEFSNGQTMFVYNTKFNAKTFDNGTSTFTLPYNGIILLDSSNNPSIIIKVVPTGGTNYTTSVSGIEVSSLTNQDAFNTAFDSSVAYNIESVRGAFSNNVVGKLLYGLPSTYEELYNWAQIYKGQFTYPDATNSAAAFHTNLILQAIAYELTWDDSTNKTGWKTASNRDANVKAVTDLVKTTKTEADVISNFGYVFNYLKDLDEYTNKSIGYLGAGKQITEINNKIVGNASTDKDYSNSTVMIGMTTVTSLDMRTDQYPGIDIGTFSLSTGVKSQYYIEIPANSSSKSGAMVVANLLSSPELQAKFFEETGNGYNIDTSKTYSGDSKDIYSTYFGFTSSWDKYLTNDVLEDVTVNATMTGIAGIYNGAWKTEVGTA